MNEIAKIMKAEIHSVSNYRALIVSRIFLSICLIASTIFVGVLGYPQSPLYIFLFLNLLPSIVSFAFKDYAKKYKNKLLTFITVDSPFRLNNLKKKYHYTRLNYISNSLSFLLALVLLLFWQIYCKKLQTTNLFLIYMPSIIIILNVLIRTLLNLFYRVKLPFDLSHNRL